MNNLNNTKICPLCGKSVDTVYPKEQAEILYRQWEFYANLTWRIPNMAVTLNAGFFIVLGIIAREGLLNSFKPLFGILFFAIGILTILYGFRLYRASILSQSIINDLQDKIDNIYGVKGIVRTTRDIKWKKWACFGSRKAMAFTLIIWGIFISSFGILYSALMLINYL